MAASKWSAPTAGSRCSRPRAAPRRWAKHLDTKDKAEAPQTFPNGCHIAEVEIDPDTGKFDIVAYTAVDDCGNVLDQTVVEGQVQGRSPRASGRR